MCSQKVILNSKCFTQMQGEVMDEVAVVVRVVAKQVISSIINNNSKL